MKEQLLRWLRRKPSAPETKFGDSSASSRKNPPNEFWLRYARLKEEAALKKQQGGDSQLEQQTKELIALTMGYVRKSINIKKSEVPRVIQVSREEYELAEAGILEDEKFDPLLERWLAAFGYDRSEFLAQAEERARIIIDHKRRSAS